MRLSDGVEWSLHVLLTLAWLDDDEPVSTAKLAASHELPAGYLSKHLQSLTRANLLESVPGARGGFRLARDAASISLLDVVEAIDGQQSAFRCSEIRQRGMGKDLPAACFDVPCAINAAMLSAESAWREELARQTIADISATAAQHAPGARDVARDTFAREATVPDRSSATTGAPKT